MLHKQSWEGSQREGTANYNPSFIFSLTNLLRFFESNKSNLYISSQSSKSNLLIYRTKSGISSISFQFLILQLLCLSVPVILIEWFARKNEQCDFIRVYSMTSSICFNKQSWEGSQREETA